MSIENRSKDPGGGWAARIATTAAAAALACGAPAIALAQDAPVPDKGDVAWLLVATLLVILMTIPGLALFYGGLVRAKNILSVLMQVMVGFSLIVVLWCIYGYSLAFTEGSAFIGGLGRVFLDGTFDAATGSFAMGATFSKGVVIPELLFVAFQATFAGITCCLIVGAFAERMRFSAVLVFMVIWFTISYLPIAHMVWFWMGPDAYTGADVVDAMNGKAGLIWQWGALEAGNGAVLAFLNTLLATSAAVIAWSFAEWALKGHPSMLGAASGAVAGLVAITPAAGNVGMMGALVIGLVAGVVCLWGVTGLKKLLGADDSLDVFGVHGIGGILGALLTGVFNTQSLGGPGLVTDWVTATVGSNPIGAQLWIQAKGVGLTIVWSAVAAFIAFKVADLLIGLRVPEETEREGLDLTEHGERAYTG